MEFCHTLGENAILKLIEFSESVSQLTAEPGWANHSQTRLPVSTSPETYNSLVERARIARVLKMFCLEANLRPGKIKASRALLRADIEEQVRFLEILLFFHIKYATKTNYEPGKNEDSIVIHTFHLHHKDLFMI